MIKHTTLVPNNTTSVTLVSNSIVMNEDLHSIKVKILYKSSTCLAIHKTTGFTQCSQESNPEKRPLRARRSRGHSNIAQIAPISFQTSIPHKPRQMRWGELHASVVTEWPPLYCWHKLLPRGHQTATKETSNRSSQLNQYLSYKPHSSFKTTWTFEDFVYVLQMILLT